MTAIPTSEVQRNSLATVREDDNPVFHWTVERYLHLIEAGLLSESDRTELINGIIFSKMPSNKPHDKFISYVEDYFTERFFRQHTLRTERAIRLDERSMPEPDYVVAVYREDKYSEVWPTPPDILLLIEVSDSTLHFDRNAKKQIYARAGIQEYWIVNVSDEKIEVHLTPDPTSAEYARTTHYGRGDQLESPFAGDVDVDAILPPA